jgi:hypothetical protein
VARDGRPSSLARFWQDTTLFGVASVVAGIANYFFSVLAAHGLGPARFGTLVTFLNVLSVLLIPQPVATLVYTRVGRRPGAWREALLLWAVGAALFVGTLAATPMLTATLRVAARLIPLYALAVVPSFALAANLGALQRARTYARVGLVYAATSLLNLAAVSIALVLRLPLAGFGLLLSLAAWVVWALSRLLAARIPPGEPTPTSGLLAGTASAGTLFTLFSLTDSLIARHTLPLRAAGLYIGLSTVGSSLTFFSGTFGTVMLTAILEDPLGSARYLLRAVALFLLTALVGEALFLAAGPLVLTVVLGPAFLAVRPYLPLYGLAMIALGLLNVLLLFTVALRRWLGVGVAAAGYLVWVLALLAERSIAGFTAATAVTMTLTVLATTAAVLWRRCGETFAT